MHILNDQRGGELRALSHTASLSVTDGWRWCVSLFTLLVFVLVVATAGSHVHDSTAATHDCAVCSAVVDAVGAAPPAPALVQQLAATAYLLVQVAPLLATYACPPLLPPSCGPPALSA